MEKRTFKAINFDLDTKALKEYYPKSRRSAYREIQSFLEDNGFSHRQWSGYVSNNKMNSMDISKLNDKLWKTFPWLEQCVNKLDVTDIGKTFDLKQIHQEMIKTDQAKGKFFERNSDGYNMGSWRNAVEQSNHSIRAASTQKQFDKPMNIGERE